jgi:hypothetical protein
VAPDAISQWAKKRNTPGKCRGCFVQGVLVSVAVVVTGVLVRVGGLIDNLVLGDV